MANNTGVRVLWVAVLFLTLMVCGMAVGLDRADARITDLEKQVETLQAEIRAQNIPKAVSVETPKETRIHAGQYKITHYEPWVTGTNRTASQKTASDGVGLWVAANPEDFPLGTELYIDGYGYRTVEDTGVPQGTIDVLVSDEETAVTLGVRRGIDVWRVKTGLTAQAE